jgi:6-phosphogluconate dehydrogenase (decarboxylating)
MKTTETGRLPDETSFPGDVVIVNGRWQKGKTLFDCVDNLKAGDIIIKGANCIDSNRKRAGILIGHPKGGTIAAAIQAVVGQRVKLILPVGLEKRITEDLDTIANLLNAPDSTGPRMFTVTGEIITEIEAIELLFGLKSKLVAAGGVCGAEGSIWLAIEGDSDKLENAKTVLKEIARESQFQIT